MSDHEHSAIAQAGLAELALRGAQLKCDVAHLRGVRACNGPPVWEVTWVPHWDGDDGYVMRCERHARIVNNRRREYTIRNVITGETMDGDVG